MVASAAKPLIEAQPAEKPMTSRKAKITSKGQITIPVDVRRRLGVSAGDQLIFETGANGEIRLHKADPFPFEKFRGMGTGVPELEEGPEAIITYFRRERGHDEFDHLD